MNKIERSLRNINRYVDDDYKKLSDKLKNLELSYKRSKNLLRMFQHFLDQLNFYACPIDLWQKAEYLHRRLTLELDGLENYKGIKNER